MNSMDIFDTLIGRWYYYPESIFRELEETYPFENFTWLRKHAEITSNDKTFDGIYNKFQELTGVSDSVRDTIKEREFALECSRTFKIPVNADQLNGRDTVLISDTYFSKERLQTLLEKNGITNYADIYCSYDGKSSRRIWREIKPDYHIGDNEISDYYAPGEYGIEALHFTYSELSDMEVFLERSGFHRLAYFSRMMRLSYPSFDNETSFMIWAQQASLNIPILILESLYIHTKYASHGIVPFFTMRDCNLLVKLYTALYPKDTIVVYNSSRDLYLNPTDSFITYSKELVKKHPSFVVVDLQGTGESANLFFKGALEVSPILHTVVYSDLENKNYVDYMVHRRDGYTDVIERLNYDVVGKLVDVGLDGTPKRQQTQYNYYIEFQRSVTDLAVGILKSGFDLKLEYSEEIENCIKQLLTVAEQDCTISTVVNHEEI